MKITSVSLIYFLLFSCSASSENSNSAILSSSSPDSVVLEKQQEPLFCNADVRVGAAQTDQYVSSLKGKNIGIVGNQSSIVNGKHLVDTLMSLGINVVKVFSPEHGFRGDADAGEKVANGIDPKSGLPVISLYGSNKKPSVEQLAGIDILLFDIQDVGARFYTYISTLHYVMQAAAENGQKVIVLDRPNPNGHYVDGPVLNSKFSSFVGMHQVPVVHGMTVGEYAQMINSEGWLGDNLKCELEVIKCSGWDHTKFYELPIAPSPNLKNMTAIYLYPSLCFFEGTVVSVGRGTDFPFQIIGHPKFKVDELEKLYSFKPAPKPGASHPLLVGETCYGYDLHELDVKEYRAKAKLDLSYLIEFYTKLKMGTTFFLKSNFINNLAGNDQLKAQIIAGKSLQEIEASWQDDLTNFKAKRKLYLLYTDFE